MIYTPLTKTALKIAYNAHHGQLDKGGMPYIFHPYAVAEQMDDEFTVCTALLHDVLEDTSLTLDSLRDFGFPELILQAVSLLTKSDNIPYPDYISRIRSNPVARRVKIADLLHNLDVSRLDSPPDESRIQKYRQALQLLAAP